MGKDIRTDQELREHVLEWLRTNDIDPRDIPEDAYVTYAGDQLTTDLWVRNADGRLQFAPGMRELARTTGTFPISVSPPADVAEWLRPRCPTCGR